ncbi:MAG: ABC transporter substrate-binding protein [Betaproteobacteria bacterium]
MQFNRRRFNTAIAAGAATVAAPSVLSQSAQPIKIGLVSITEGPFAVMGADCFRGAELALRQASMRAGGRPLEVIRGGTNATPDRATAEVRKLVEQDKVDIIVGPLSGSEGIAIKNYSRSQPQCTFMNGSSAAQQTTLQDPSPNFFRFSMDGVQWMAGLGTEASKKYKRVAAIGEDYSFPWAQLKGFALEFCRGGGKIVERFWVPLGNRDYSAVISRIPTDIDAIYVALGGSDAVNFLTQYDQSGGDKDLVGGSITVDQTVLSFRGQKRPDWLVGTLAAGPIGDTWDNPAWRKYVADYRAAFKDGLPTPSLFATAYFQNMMAVLTALDTVKGDLGNNHQALRQTLSTMTLNGPTGPVRLDANRNAIGNIFVTQVAKEGNNLVNRVLRVVPNVNQTLGQPPEQFLQVGFAARNSLENQCR